MVEELSLLFPKFKLFSPIQMLYGLQATRFNDETNDFDVLVASDAIGMGLNLNISRIIFSTLQKFDGTGTRDLTVSEIKQIAGISQQKIPIKISKSGGMSSLMFS